MLSLVGSLPSSDPGAVTTAATGINQYAWLVIALPLLGAALLMVGGKALDKVGPLLAVCLSGASFVLGLIMLLHTRGMSTQDRGLKSDVHLFDWIDTSSLHLAAGLRVDQLSLTFVMLITFVGTLIHVYSLGYMEHDPDRRRFFAYLNLFVAAMLTLVLADSFVGLFVGWEGVGLASYLLIGFWNWNPAYATAANKAFVVNRVGDLGMLLALFTMYLTFGRLDFNGVFAAAPHASQTSLTWMGLFLLVGACGKSAQFPLQSWLGDAMAGPTPVSALIHAATMVTAGVYLIVRSHVIFDAAPNARLAVCIVGAITLMFGAIVGCAKDDMKKALAASTMSQIGYMILAAGLGPVGYVFAIFHLLTHGFFKAGMFLGAGSVMHGMNDQVDMRRFGGLSAVMRITWVTFGLGFLAIIGFPLLSGFWSKDKIIEAAFVGDGWRPWVFGLTALIAAGITAFYMSRLFFMVFHGKRRWTDDVHPHESPLTMTVPMMILAVGSAFLGLILGPTGIIQHWLEPVTGHTEGDPKIPSALLMVITFLLVAAGVALAWLRYWRDEVPVTPPVGSLVTQAARRDLGQDDLNEAVFQRPGLYLTRALVFADNRGVDGASGGLAAAIGGTSARVKRAQNGFVRSYALTMLVGVVAILGVVWVVQ
ncbi:NADH-quinone oxidoreductase subunit L [Allobranchiibius huperziae]|uniref:NADH-quinone oxidoreductase subunit L n=1 Tax=Allobranchiibius huperziae TaxID=1874116 RepID=A0A853DIN9_9MICO|nr:NADH-quinone oxidoreductase subunit L [Allobranchiibius huperziae]